MSETSVADRLKEFIEKMGLSYSQFADRCNIPRPSLSQLITGRNKKINDSMVRQIHNEFPNLSVVWLLFGEGPMQNSMPDLPSSAADSDGSDGLHDFLSENSFDGVNFVSENPNSYSGDSATTKNLKDEALKTAINDIKSIDSKENKLSKKLKEIGEQLEFLRKNPRKVTQIMVYYDDSTFETFKPDSGAIRN